MLQRVSLRWVVVGLGIGGALSVACSGGTYEDGVCVYDADCEEISTQCSPSRCVEGMCQNMPSDDPACAESSGDEPSSGPNTSDEPSTGPNTTDEPTTVEPTTVEPTTTSDTEETTSTDPDSTGTTGGGAGVCGSDHTEGSPGIDGCVTESCCAEFDACNANAECAECLALEKPGDSCAELSEYSDYQFCIYFGCQETVCNTELVVEGRDGEPDYGCHGCIEMNCCGDAQYCLMDPVACAWCLAEDDPIMPQGAECQAAGLTIQQGAQIFQQCIAMNCAAECETL